MARHVVDCRSAGNGRAFVGTTAVMVGGSIWRRSWGVKEASRCINDLEMRWASISCGGEMDAPRIRVVSMHVLTWKAGWRGPVLRVGLLGYCGIDDVFACSIATKR